MSDAKSTKLNIREDRAVAISSSSHGANVNAIGFNVIFIAIHNPKLAVEIMKLFHEARAIKEDDPIAPEEDQALFTEEVKKFLIDKSED